MLRTIPFALVGLLGGSLVLGACSGAESTRPRSGSIGPPPEVPTAEPPESIEETGPPSDIVVQVIQDALRSDGSLSYETLLRRLGAPRAVQTEPVPNQYVQGQVDTLRTLVYTGMEALVYDVTNDAKTFLVRLSLSGTQYTTPEGIHVGLSTERVLEQLGPPTRRNTAQGEWIYQESRATPTSMVVHVRDGRVVQIDWEFYFA
ncbi:MAG: hypothetical protein ABEL97_05810 [Salinibacter sp.]